jgi:hypothetical protein
MMARTCPTQPYNPTGRSDGSVGGDETEVGGRRERKSRRSSRQINYNEAAKH